jgi:DNA-binding MarR family transcriptional regulator
MDPQDLRTLQLLEEIEKNHMPSQRQLSRHLNISLGLVNSFVKRLAQKGLFKITHIPKNRVKYILTPKGAAEKTRLTYEYIKYSFTFYRDARKKLRELFQGFEKEGVDSVVFYGVSDLAEIAYLSLQETDIRLTAIVDPLKVGEEFLNYTIEDPKILDDNKFDKILITTIEQRNAVQSDIHRKKIASDRIAVVS